MIKRVHHIIKDKQYSNCYFDIKTSNNVSLLMGTCEDIRRVSSTWIDNLYVYRISISNIGVNTWVNIYTLSELKIMKPTEC